MKNGLESHPVVDIADEEVEEGEEHKTEAYKDRNVHITVTQSPGFLCHISATARMPIEPHTLFKQVITHPDNAAIFRHLDRCSYRKVLEDDGQGRRKVEVEHEASWRFLLFHGTFHTRLLVEEDDNARTMRFEIKPGTTGIMKKFHGAWKIEPHPDDPQHASLSTLDQDICLSITPPRPFKWILNGISCRQVRSIFEDIQKEADRMRSGRPTLPPWEQVAHKEICVPAPGDSQAAPPGPPTSPPPT